MVRKQANSFSRCDQYPDCEDYSDEALCWLVGKPKNYEKDFAPFTQSGNGSLEKVPVEIRVFVGLLFSCKDAAQQDLMYVCPCVCVCVTNVTKFMQNVPEFSRMHAESSRIFKNA